MLSEVQELVKLVMVPTSANRKGKKEPKVGVSSFQDQSALLYNKLSSTNDVVGIVVVVGVAVVVVSVVQAGGM